MNPSTPSAVAGPPPMPESNSSSESDNKLWTTTQVAEFLQVSPKTVYNLRKRGLPFVYLGGAVRFVPQEIKNYLASNRGLSSHRLRQMIRKGDRP